MRTTHLLVPSLTLALALALALALSFNPLLAAQEAADRVLRSGDIYTVDPAQPWAEALAIRDGVIVYVGDDQGALAYIGPQTDVVDLDGLAVLPGLHDSHMHLLEAFHRGFSCQVPFGGAIENAIPVVSQCSNAVPGSGWLIGYGYSIENMVRHLADGGESPLAILDRAVADRPVALLESSSHSVWVNSEALRQLEFDSETPNPPGGVILREKSGELLGLLLDGAGEIAMDEAFQSAADFRQDNYPALLDGLRLAARNGITSIADARVYWRRGYLGAYRKAERRQTLTARVTLGLWAYPYLGDSQQIARLSSFYAHDPESLLQTSQIKIYSDGEVSHSTAALFEPYVGAQLTDPTGLTYFDETRLTRYVTELERIGFDFHIHAIGDRGVHQALNAIEAAADTNGAGDRRHRLTHVELLAPEDVPRFAELGVFADFQVHSNNDRFYWPHIGKERTAERALRLRDVWETGASVVLSSDYDVGSPSPFVGMQRALERPGQGLPSRDVAVRAYTIEAARLLRQEDRVGSLEVGKEADLVVLDRNPLTVPLRQLGRTRVLWTLLRGEEVYWDPSF